MKALSLLQPWASLVISGAKTIETRSWATPHRGPLLIHASLGKAGSIFCKTPPFSKYIAAFEKLPFGAVIGEATLVKIVSVDHLKLSEADLDKLTLEEKAFGDYSGGRFAWFFENPIAFEQPIPARGHLRLWDFC